MGNYWESVVIGNEQILGICIDWNSVIIGNGYLWVIDNSQILAVCNDWNPTIIGNYWELKISSHLK